MSIDRLPRLAAVLLVCVAGAACGKKGSPLPPLQRIPAEVADLTARRFGDTHYVSLTVPSSNVDGVSPADITRVEVYAITADRIPEPAEYGRAEFREVATLVASEPVRRPRPPLPPTPPAQPPPPPLPEEPGLPQGGRLVFVETLTDELRQPVELPPLDVPGLEDEAEPQASRLSLPLGARDDRDAIRRFYFARPVGPGRRSGPVSALATVPLGPTSRPPSLPPEATWDESSLTLTWQSAPDARLSQMAPAEGDLLPARPVVEGPSPTRYNVYDVTPGGAAVADPASVAIPPGEPPPPTDVPTPLNPEALSSLAFTLDPVWFGTERCFVVRPVDQVAGVAIDGPASPPVCVTPVDTFPPAAPQSVAAVASAGAISLIWDTNEETDLEGYLVLRGPAPGDTLRALTPSPIAETTFRDDTVDGGVRYVYVVVAVDAAGNLSAQSARVEETARQ